MADGASLENWWAAMSRGFESHALRSVTPTSPPAARRGTAQMSQKRDRSAKPARPAVIARHGRLKRATRLAIGPRADRRRRSPSSSSPADRSRRSRSSTSRATSRPRRIEADSQGPPPNIAAIEGGFNILLVGSDTREGQGGIGGNESAVLNDVTMLLHVAQDQQSATARQHPARHGRAAPGVRERRARDRVSRSTSRSSTAASPAPSTTVQNLTGLDIQFAGLITFTGRHRDVGRGRRRRGLHRRSRSTTRTPASSSRRAGSHTLVGRRGARVPALAATASATAATSAASGRSRSSSRRWCARSRATTR